MSTNPPASPERIRLINQRLSRLDQLGPALRACVVADIKRETQRHKVSAARRPRSPGASRRRPHLPALALAAVALLSSCGTPRPPAPPNVDEAARRPVNHPSELEQRRLRIQSHNESLLLQLREQRAQLQAMTIPVALEQATPQRTEQPAEPKANHVYVVTFGFGKTELDLSDDQKSEFLADAKAAEYILIRGRTDGRSDTASEARIARDRAARMRAMLIAGGADPSRIRVTYQPAGDHLASNTSDRGRALNRRVEVELYAVRPIVQVFESQAPSSI